eukprot:3806741-Rhodomonas_salina.4
MIALYGMPVQGIAEPAYRPIPAYAKSVRDIVDGWPRTARARCCAATSGTAPSLSIVDCIRPGPLLLEYHSMCCRSTALSASTTLSAISVPRSSLSQYRTTRCLTGSTARFAVTVPHHTISQYRSVRYLSTAPRCA